MKNLIINDCTLAAGATDIGLRRDTNEDAYLIDPKNGLIVLADGIGGQDAGEVASVEAINVVQKFLSEDNQIDAEKTRSIISADSKTGNGREEVRPSQILNSVHAAVVSANKKICIINQNKKLSPERSMGTTLTGVVCLPNDYSSVVVFHVGDSRLYRFRDGQIEQLTRDDTIHQDWLENGQIGEEPKRNILSRCIGIDFSLRPTVFAPAFRKKDLLLLCSDGLSDLVTIDELMELMARINRKQLHDTCNALIAAALNRGAPDNITAIIISRH